MALTLDGDVLTSGLGKNGINSDGSADRQQF